MFIAINSYVSVEKLLNAGIDKDVKDVTAVALHYAFDSCCDISLLLYLLKKSCKLEVPNVKGIFPLELAVLSDRIENVQAALELKNDNCDYLIDIYKPQGNNETLLQIAEKHKAEKCLGYLRQLYKERELQRAYQKLHNLSEKLFPQSLPTQQLFINLIKEKASFEQLIDFIIENQGNLNETEQDQITLLMMATSMGSYEATKKLIIAGADKDKTDGHATLLHHACADGSPQILTLLLEQGCSLEILDSTGDYPELWAVEKDQLETLQIVLEFKRNGIYAVDINKIQGSTNKNLLDSAKQFEAAKCIAYLRQLIADREKQQISEKISNLHLELALAAKTTTPILFSPSLQLQQPQ